jgi:predicted TPR repeat methyltransferase
MNVKDYWDGRYSSGGDSGRGSYNDHFEYKNSIINDLIKKYNIKSITDFGCGDGNQISDIQIEYYNGLDISSSAIELCEKKYCNDGNKKFKVYNQNYLSDEKTDLTMSLDVIYHIFEDDLYNQYMNDLVNTSNKYVLIYSSNFEDTKWNNHVRHRKFDDKLTNLILIERFDNPLPDCSANFYLYKKPDYGI